MSDSFTGQQINASIIRLTAAQWAAQSYVLPVGVIGIESDTGASKVGDGETAWGALPYAFGTPQLYVAAGDDPAVNGQNLLDAYAAAVASTPNGLALAEDNRAVVVCPPALYEMPATLVLASPYVDIVGLTDDVASQVLTPGPAATEGAVRGTTAGASAKFYNLTFLANGDEGIVAFTFTDPLEGTYFQNCVWKDNGAYGMQIGVSISSTFRDCTGGDVSFGGDGGTFSGTATNCTGGDGSFSGDGGTFSGTATNCTGGSNAFGGGGGGTFNGTATNCTGGVNSFGGGGTFSGIATNCTGSDDSFGGGGGTFSGTATSCTGGNGSFGGGGGTFSSTGRAAYCRLTSNDFQTPDGGGIIVLCVNGSWSEVNAAP